MISLPEPLVFEWDSGNSDKNQRKHGISNKEAENAFIHYPLLIFEDTEHSAGERRFQAFGRTEEQKLLFMVFTVRKSNVRIISARRMDKKERRMYEKAEKAQKYTGI